MDTYFVRTQGGLTKEQAEEIRVAIQRQFCKWAWIDKEIPYVSPADRDKPEAQEDKQ